MEDGRFHGRNPDDPCEGSLRTISPDEWSTYRNTNPGADGCNKVEEEPAEDADTDTSNEQ